MPPCARSASALSNPALCARSVTDSMRSAAASRWSAVSISRRKARKRPSCEEATGAPVPAEQRELRDDEERVGPGLVEASRERPALPRRVPVAAGGRSRPHQHPSAAVPAVEEDHEPQRRERDRTPGGACTTTEGALSVSKGALASSSSTVQGPAVGPSAASAGSSWEPIASGSGSTGSTPFDSAVEDTGEPSAAPCTGDGATSSAPPVPAFQAAASVGGLELARRAEIAPSAAPARPDVSDGARSWGGSPPQAASISEARTSAAAPNVRASGAVFVGGDAVRRTSGLEGCRPTGPSPEVGARRREKSCDTRTTSGHAADGVVSAAGRRERFRQTFGRARTNRRTPQLFRVGPSRPS